MSPSGTEPSSPVRYKLVLSSWIKNWPLGVAQALIEELVLLVVVGPTYGGGSPVSVLLEAEHEADSVIVKEAVTVTVSAGAVVVPTPMVSKLWPCLEEIVNSHLSRNFRLSSSQ